MKTSERRHGRDDRGAQARTRTFPRREDPDAVGVHQPQESGINLLLKLLYVLLSLSIIISLFGIVNTLVLTVFERTREIGMLRAVGMTRRQVRNMIRHEAIITALLGAALGIPVGIVLALMVGKAIDYPAFTIPWSDARRVRRSRRSSRGSSRRSSPRGGPAG